MKMIVRYRMEHHDQPIFEREILLEVENVLQLLAGMRKTTEDTIDGVYDRLIELGDRTRKVS